MEDTLRRLGRRIREIRIQRGFGSQEDFADYCKMHRTFLGHLETGRKDFRLSTIIRVAQALGVTLEELFAGLEGQDQLEFKGTKRLQGADREGALKEVAKLEHSVERLKEIISPRRKPTKKPITKEKA